MYFHYIFSQTKLLFWICLITLEILLWVHRTSFLYSLKFSNKVKRLAMKKYVSYLFSQPIKTGAICNQNNFTLLIIKVLNKEAHCFFIATVIYSHCYHTLKNAIMTYRTFLSKFQLLFCFLISFKVTLIKQNLSYVFKYILYTFEILLLTHRTAFLLYPLKFSNMTKKLQ